MKPADDRYYPPGRYPEGWYFVEIARNLPNSGLLQKHWMGKQIVAWRDSVGEVCVSEAFCPHLGGHLGPESGGLREGRTPGLSDSRVRIRHRWPLCRYAQRAAAPNGKAQRV